MFIHICFITCAMSKYTQIPNVSPVHNENSSPRVGLKLMTPRTTQSGSPAPHWVGVPHPTGWLTNADFFSSSKPVRVATDHRKFSVSSVYPLTLGTSLITTEGTSGRAPTSVGNFRNTLYCDHNFVRTKLHYPFFKMNTLV